VDVGASLGFHSLHASRVVGELGRVIGFEPHPDSFALLQAHVTMNRIVNCEIHPEALARIIHEDRACVTSVGFFASAAS
jgi:FkbM family methyltransferase